MHNVTLAKSASQNGMMFMVLSAYQGGSTPDSTRLRHLPNTCREPCEASLGIVHKAATSNAGSDAHGNAPWSSIRLSLKVFYI